MSLKQRFAPLAGALAALLVVAVGVRPAAGQLLEFPEAADDLVVEAVCIGVNAGIFPHPDPTLCHVYVSCTFERPLVYQCAAGLVFDAGSLQCAPGDREQCVDRAEPDWAAVCATASYAFHAVPADCGRFVFCALGQPNRYECPAGEIWSQAEGACLLGDRDTCEPLNLCADRPDGPVAHPTDCTQYLECAGGRPTVRACARGLVFDAAAGRCVVGNTDSCAPAVDLCRAVANDLRPHPNECHLFVFCSLGEASVLICPPGEIFRPDIRFCVPGNRATCQFSPVETACVGRPAGVVPHPDACDLFLACSNGAATVQRCPAGSVFDPPAGRCAAGDVATCLVTEGLCALQPDDTVLEHPHRCELFIVCRGGTASVNPCPPGEILRVDAQFCVPGDADTCERLPLERMCEGRDGGLLLPHPTDCGRFVACQQGATVDSACPAGHIFTAPAQSCVPGNAQTCTPLTGVCAAVPDGTVLEHPDRCDFFVWCTDGRPTVNPCPPGEILQVELQFCLPGSADTCQFAPLETMCGGQPDGALFPYAPDCAQFVRCVAQAATVERCAVGSIYHAPSRACVPGSQQTCARFEGLCAGRPDGFVPHPTVCTSFVFCEAGQDRFVECPPGTIFLEGACELGHTGTCTPTPDVCAGQPSGAIVEHPNVCGLYVLCGAEDAAPVALPCPPGQILNVEAQFCVPGDADSCQVAPVETMCQGVAEGAIFPYPGGDCTRFVQCADGGSTVFECRAGYVLDVRGPACRPGNTATCEFVGEVCQGRPDAWVIEHPNLCGHFILCEGGVVQVHPCPPGEILRPDAQFCAPGDAASCSFDPVERMCAGRPDGALYPHPTDCRASVRCEGGAPLVDTCRPGTIFRMQTRSCVPGNGNTCEPLDTLCAGRPDGVLPHPGGCELFILCTSGVTSALRCPEGEILHPEFLTCAAGDASDCSLAPVTTEPPIISVCEGRPDGNYTHPLLCYLFIRCTAGETDILSCPPDHIFVGAIRDCAPGSQETCIPF